MSTTIKKLQLAVMMSVICWFLVPSLNVEASGLTQTTIGKDNATISWTPKNNAISYSVYIGPDYNNLTKYGADLPATTTSVNILGLTQGKTYCVKVSYLYKYSSSDKIYEHSVGSIYDLKTLPPKVKGINQEKWWYYIKSLDVSWDAVESADLYEYTIKDSKGKTKKKGTTYGTRVSLSGISNTQVYTVQVRAVTELNGQKYYSEWSNKAYCFTQPHLKSAKVSGKKLVIKYPKVAGVTGYDVYVSTKPKTGYKKVKSVGKNVTTVKISKFKGKAFSAKKKYYVYLVAKKKVGKTTYTSGKLYYWDTKSSKIYYF